MARPPRIIYNGAFYHVPARGNERRKIFLSRADYDKFLDYLSGAAHKYAIILHAFALMGNHYRLIRGNSGRRPERFAENRKQRLHNILQSQEKTGWPSFSGTVQVYPDR
jgi:REP element-mobilizing transposase RayT